MDTKATERSEKASPLFSILIPTWNNLGFLKLCLESIEKNSSFNHQVIIYVNDGSDGTLDYVKEKGLDYVHSPSNVGICFALNALRPLVKTEYILYMNDDMYVCPLWDKYLWDEIQRVSGADGNKKWFISATLIQPRSFFSKSVIAPANYGESVEEFDEERLLAEYDGNRTIAFLEPAYSEDNGWTLRNQTSEAFIGAWADGAAEDGMEFAANKASGQASHMDIYAIGRTKWMQNYEKLESAGDSVNINLSYLITNNSFERFDENRKPLGWTLLGDGEVERDWLDGCDGTLYMNNWQSSGQLDDRSVSQVVNGLPKGKYRLSVYRMSSGDNAFLFANGKKQPLGSNDTAGEEVSLDFELKETTDVTIGVELNGFTSNNLKFDNFRLAFLGNASTETGISSIRNNVKAHPAIYNLGGQRLDEPRKGINIINGKKVFRK